MSEPRHRCTEFLVLKFERVGIPHGASHLAAVRVPKRESFGAFGCRDELRRLVFG